MGQMKLGLVGFGFIAERGHVPAYFLRGDIEVVAIADVSPERRKRAAEAFPEARIFADHEELLAEVGASLDVVDICVPPYAHAAIAIAALEAGVHVLCEKPLASTEEEARSMLEAARANRRVLLPAHNYRHAPVIKAVRGALVEQLVGPVHLVTLETFRPTHARGTVGWRPDWRREAQYSGGGIAMDHGPHTFYLAFEWLRSHPTAISATSSSSTVGATTEDTFLARAVFPGGEAIATLTWVAGFRRVIYTLHGERGAIRVEDDDVEISVMKGPVGNRTWETVERSVPSDWQDAGHAGWFSPLFDELRTAIANDDYVPRSTRDAYACLAVVAAGYRSAQRGGVVTSIEPAVVPETGSAGRPRFAGAQK